MSEPVRVPDGLVATQINVNGAAGRAFVAALPDRVEHFLRVWGLRYDGPPMHGMASLVLPVRRVADGVPAVLKMQVLDEETEAEGAALRAWDGGGCVRLLAEDAATGTLLLERLDPSRSLSAVEDVHGAMRALAGLLARLTVCPASAVPGLRRLADVAAAMLDQVPEAVGALTEPAERRLVEDCAAAVREVAGDLGGHPESLASPGPGGSGERLLHWDLHFDNVLAPLPGSGSGSGSGTDSGSGSGRGEWLAIDPKPLAGDPGFELMPSLANRFDPADVRWRFDLLTEALGMERDRGRARAWTLGRVLQNALWDVQDGEHRLQEEQMVIARMLLGR